MTRILTEANSSGLVMPSVAATMVPFLHVGRTARQEPVIVEPVRSLLMSLSSQDLSSSSAILSLGEPPSELLEVATNAVEEAVSQAKTTRGGSSLSARRILCC